MLPGGVVEADCDSFESLASKPGIKKVVLTNSGGGNASSSYCIGALVRKLGLSTGSRVTLPA